MKISCLPFLIIVFCLLQPPCNAQQHQKALHATPRPLTFAQVQHKLMLLKTKLEQGKIKRIDVFYLPLFIETFGSVDPEQLEHQDCDRMTLIEGSRKIETIATALSQLKISPTQTEMIDCRWGLIFHIIDGGQVHVFVDGFGKWALINGKCVTIDHSFMKVLEDNFGDCFANYDAPDLNRITSSGK